MDLGPTVGGTLFNFKSIIIYMNNIESETTLLLEFYAVFDIKIVSLLLVETFRSVSLTKSCCLFKVFVFPC